MGVFAQRRYMCSWSPAGKLYLSGSTENPQMAGRKGANFQKYYNIAKPEDILCHFRQVLSNDPSMCSSYCAYRPQTVHIQGMTFPDCLNVGGHLPPSCV